MLRFTSSRAALATLAISLLSLGLGAGCGSPGDADAGVDGDVLPDTGPPPTRDGGPDAGSNDAGPRGCQADCEFVELALGVRHSCGRRENGEVMCWGRNQEFQLGDARSRHEDCAPPGSNPEDCSGTPVNVRYQSGAQRPIIADATQITTEAFSTSCALRPGGELWCWSFETVPETSGGVQEIREIAQQEADFVDVTQASASGGHLCVISGADDAVLCVGSNTRGQLGTGEFNELIIDPVAVQVPVGGGGGGGPPLPDAGIPLLDAGPSDAGPFDAGPFDAGMPDAGPLVDAGPPVDAGPIETMPLVGAVEVIVSQRSFTCARTADAVWCWGINDNNQLGDGLATAHRECRDTDNNPFDCSPVPVRVGGDAPIGAVDDIAVGPSHACVIQSGEVLCWGDNRGGQCGIDPTVESSIGVPTAVPGIDDATQVAAGSGLTCVLRASGAVQCWGVNVNGQLGDGLTSHGQTCTRDGEAADCSFAPVNVTTIDDATHLAANTEHACAIRADGSVWCWGLNTNRELGDGTRENRFEPVAVRGTVPQ